jgi:hypothetical protein
LRTPGQNSANTLLPILPANPSRMRTQASSAPGSLSARRCLKGNCCLRCRGNGLTLGAELRHWRAANVMATTFLSRPLNEASRRREISWIFAPQRPAARLSGPAYFVQTTESAAWPSSVGGRVPAWLADSSSYPA